MKLTDIITDDVKSSIKNAISSAELQTSGEIRVHFEEECAIDPVVRAWQVFEKLGMHQTELRNGVLFYVAVSSRKFAVIGDEGINQRVEANFWDITKETVLFHLSKGDYKTAITVGVLEAGNQLKKYFPYRKNDINELPNDISIG